MQTLTIPSNPQFKGAKYDLRFDKNRLKTQLGRIYSLMIGGVWFTLKEIADRTRDPEASISAQLRHLRKEEFGSYTVESRIRGAREGGLYEYRLLPPEPKEDVNGQLKLF